MLITAKEDLVRNRTNSSAKPFLKWAGGKTQLLPTIQSFLPDDIENKNMVYIEPFVGGGAVLFWMLSQFKNLKKAVINDINADLINAYNIIASSPVQLTDILNNWQKEYHSLNDEKRKEYYYAQRNLYNDRISNKETQAALFIFLNRTCFNGLYRVNRNNLFNVPIGSYKNPTICDKENILAVSAALQKVEILNIDFEETLNYAEANTFFYLDPPYKPLSNTSSFNSYAKDEFNDDEQVRLKNFCEKLDILGHKWLLSNSDVKSGIAENNFFDDLYNRFNISRVKAKRIINANPEKRGELDELLIANYSYEKALSVA